MTTGPTAGFPLPLRNALAALAIAALDRADARAALEWLADAAAGSAPPDVRAVLAERHLVEPDGTLLEVHRGHSPRIGAHAARALRAAAAFEDAAAGGAVAGAVARAIALWNERLFFEVHEVLEAEWVRATGTERQALQGMIQIAVALHHHLHGNPRGARTLMREGRERLAACAAALPVVDVPALLAATQPWEHALEAGSTPPEAPPRATRRAAA